MARLSALLFALWAAALPAAPASQADARLDEARRAIVQRRPAEALRIWRDLAAAGNAEAQFQLGVQYGNGRMVAKDPVAAAKWYEAAARQGHARAQLALARLRQGGAGGAPPA